MKKHKYYELLNTQLKLCVDCGFGLEPPLEPKRQNLVQLIKLDFRCNGLGTSAG